MRFHASSADNTVHHSVAGPHPPPPAASLGAPGQLTLHGMSGQLPLQGAAVTSQQQFMSGQQLIVTSQAGQPVEFNHAIHYVNKIKVCHYVFIDRCCFK